MKNMLTNFKNPRIIFAFSYDIFIAASTFWMALFLRLETINHSVVDYRLYDRVFYVTIGIFSLSYFVNGLYKGVWRFSSMHDLIRVIKACLMGTILSMNTWLFINRMQGMPRSLFAIHFFLMVVGLGGGRFFYRFLKDQTSMRKILGGSKIDYTRVLIVGAGRAGEKLLRDILATPALKLYAVGFVDDDKFKKNALIHNVRVYGDSSQIAKLCLELQVDKIFIALPSAGSDAIKKIVQECKLTHAEIKILPKLDHLLSSQVEISLLRNLNIEDLLGREQVKLDTSFLSAMLMDKVVLVTGAGGSIGSELCFQIAKFRPRLLIMADYCELFMYELEMKFKEHFPDVLYIPKILDVRDEKKVQEVFVDFRPAIVFHAAAYKHVPMMEHNPLEAIHTNVRGTKIVAEKSLEFQAEKFIMISTDKAVNPTNVMGASKRIAEMVVADLASRSQNNTQFISVRFGNVLGSNGSVIPLFKKQIQERRDITVTHPDIIRYFMSIPEASQLVLQAGSMGKGGEIFVLDMGAPVKIVDLAREMIKLAGLNEGRDIKIVYSGLRPGEKLYEELFSQTEKHQATHHGKIQMALQRPLNPQFNHLLNQLLNLENNRGDAVIHLIFSLVPEFSHAKLNQNQNQNQNLKDGENSNQETHDKQFQHKAH